MIKIDPMYFIILTVAVMIPIAIGFIAGYYARMKDEKK